MGSWAVRLEVVTGNAVGMSILVDDELVIGRHADGAGRLADDQELSRAHARIVLDGNGFCSIEDLGSTNGTFLNGLRISTPQTLSVGDTLELGATTLVLRDLPEACLRSSRPRMDAGGGAGGPRTAGASVPSLLLRLKFDLGLGDARLCLGDASEPVRLVLLDGAWRLIPASEIQRAGHL